MNIEGSQNPLVVSTKRRVTEALHTLARASHMKPSEVVESNGPGFVLITQYFSPSADAPESDAIRRSLLHTLTRNLLNDAISDVILLNEAQFDFSSLSNHNKITQLVLGRRLTFSDAFRVGNELASGRKIIIANADIFFDTSLNTILSRDGSVLNKTVLALSKWIPHDETSFTIPLRVDSQDAWIYTSPMAEPVITDANFFLGAPRCDNRLARILMDRDYRFRSILTLCSYSYMMSLD
jgi:hypothetical protein